MSEDIIRGIRCSGMDKGVYLSCAYCSRTWPAMLAASPQGEGSPIGQNDQPGLAFSDAGEP